MQKSPFNPQHFECINRNMTPFKPQLRVFCVVVVEVVIVGLVVVVGGHWLQIC